MQIIKHRVDNDTLKQTQKNTQNKTNKQTKNKTVSYKDRVSG